MRITHCFLALVINVAAVVIDEYDREINLSGFNVVIKETIEATNDKKEPLSTFTLCYSQKIDSNVALSAVQQGSDSTPLDISHLENDQVENFQRNLENATCLNVQLNSPVKNGQKVILKTLFIASHVQNVFPEEISQSESQSVLYEDFKYCLSPYEVKEQTTTIKLPGSKMHGYTDQNKEAVQKEGSSLSYGPYKNIPPFKFAPLRLHYENNKPFIQINKLVREITVSHWGNIYVDETYDIQHAGAKISGMWSRLDFSLGMTSRSGYGGFTAVLPAAAHSVYYRDDIGNVSTSNVRFEREKVVAQLRVRYPLFGGWGCMFLFGYSLPLHNALTYQKDGSRQLQMKFSSPFVDEHVIDFLEVRVVLPEGASKISYSVPFSVLESRSKKWSYLDTSGREVLILQKGNVVNSLNLDFTVNYFFPIYDVLHEPMLLVLAFFVLFLTYIFGSRIDLSVGKDESAKKRVKIFDIVQKIESVLSDHKRLVKEIDLWVSALSQKGSRSEAERVKTKAENAIRQDTVKLNDLLQQLKSVDAKSAKGFDSLLEKDRQLLEKMVSLLSSSLAGDASEKNIQTLKSGISTLKSEVGNLFSVQFQGY
eukprot:TRINITY_DN13134_c0_g4_i1.p1 TRINITY_DN13134_c0_g4~~TRINITY_DN13134_c0_g4_i1.p1  ORF type:complete len:594 (+),score=88.14 TRINITY_DN13134_c0_g4_i1:223-2004(+)